MEKLVKNCDKFPRANLPFDPTLPQLLQNRLRLILRDYLGERHQVVVSPRSVGTPDFKPRSRRFSEMGAAPAYALRDSGLASRRRRSRTAAARHPYPRGTTKGAARFGAAAPFVSIGRGSAPSGTLTSNGAVAVSRRWGSVPCGCTKKEGLLPAPR